MMFVILILHNYYHNDYNNFTLSLNDYILNIINFLVSRILSSTISATALSFVTLITCSNVVMNVVGELNK